MPEVHDQVTWEKIKWGVLILAMLMANSSVYSPLCHSTTSMTLPVHSWANVRIKTHWQLTSTHTRTPHTHMG